MPIYHIPNPGCIVICDFDGYKTPEMTKQRPVVVVSPKHPKRPELCTVVPLSTTPPNIPTDYHFKFVNNPIPGRNGETWAKCDMISTVALERLDRVKIGRGDYRILKITHDELIDIRRCIRYFLNL